MEAIPDTVMEATPTMQYDLSASGLYVHQYKHTTSMGGGRKKDTDYAGGTFYKVQYLDHTEFQAVGPFGLQAAEELQVWYDERGGNIADDDDERPEFVGNSGTRSLKFENPSNQAAELCMVAGPDVGHIKKHVANLQENGGKEIVLRSFAHAGKIGTGGWGFPICLERTGFGDGADIYVDTSDDPAVFEEYVPINCATADNVQDTEAKVDFSTNPVSITLERDPYVNYATGRTRPDGSSDYGYQAHFYDETTRTQCDPKTEDTVSLQMPPTPSKFIIYIYILYIYIRVDSYF